MITNTSSINSGTTISVEQMSPSKVLNAMTNSLVMFYLYKVPLCADIAGAYHCILVDQKASLLRLFMWFHDLEKLERGRVFKQQTQAFGDTSASWGLECGILKFVVAAALLLVTKFCLEFVRYSDNIMYSFKTIQEFREVKKDMEQAFQEYSMALKYLITSQKHDPTVLEHPKRGNARIEHTLGILWDVVEDTIVALPKYNLHGTLRGKPQGPDLIDMEDELIMKMKITRLLFLRLSAQTYRRLGNLIGPIIACIKALSSRACKIAGVHELELDLEE